MNDDSLFDAVHICRRAAVPQRFFQAEPTPVCLLWEGGTVQAGPLKIVLIQWTFGMKNFLAFLNIPGTMTL